MTNSGPLSERMDSRAPCTLTSFDKTSMTRFDRMEPATSMARHSRVYSSTTVRHLMLPPSAVASKTKSQARTTLALNGACSLTFGGPLFGVSLGGEGLGLGGPAAHADLASKLKGAGGAPFADRSHSCLSFVAANMWQVGVLRGGQNSSHASRNPKSPTRTRTYG
jgi:hypothetical protein